MTDKSLTQTRLKKLLHYDSLTGLFTRRITVTYNAKKGDVVGSDCNGYLSVRIDGKAYQLHRLAYLYMVGGWPIQIDHDNRNRADNRWVNINNGTHQDNHRNMPKQSNNKSGHTGVSWDKQTSMWAATITVDRKTIRLGRFDCIDDAAAARLIAQCNFGFHHNHGL